MLSQSRHENHGQRVETLITRWLQERQDLIALMVELGSHAAAPIAKVQAFCEVLMDYLSAGHFEIYDELLAEAEGRGQKLAEGKALLLRLQSSTDAAIRFNDLYEDLGDAAQLTQLPRELSALGLALEERFAVEDRMTALLHEKRDVASPI